jgi:Mrp family chromosome partitioning ATPase
LLACLCATDDTQPPLRTVGLLGCAGGEGVSTVAAALAAEAAATLQGPVLLVDGHFARPAAHRLLGARPDLGLVDALRDGTPLADLIRPTSVPRLSILASGQADELAADEPLGWSGLVETLKEEFELVIWDLPPADTQGPGAGIAGRLDGLILIVEAERTPRDAIQRVAAGLQARDRLLGVLLNKRPTHLPEWLKRFF